MYNEIEPLLEIYSIEVMHYDLIKENIRRNHLIKVSNNDPQIIAESFNDIVDRITSIIMTIIKKLTDFCKKAFTVIKAHTQSVNKFYNKNKDTLLSLTGLDFWVDGAEFTLGIQPNLKPFKQMIDEYNSELASIPNMTIESIKTRQNEFIDDGHLNVLRGDISGIRHPIESDKFVRVLRAAYRGGRSTDLNTSIHVTDEVFRRYMIDLPNIMEQAKIAEEIKDDALNALRKVELFFDEKVPVIYSAGTKTMKLNRLSYTDNKVKVDSGNSEMILEEERDKVDLYVRYKYNQAHEMAIIVSTVVMEYTNAYKDFMVMIKDMIKMAVYKGNKSEIGGEL